ncbi:Required for respiratory growth protein 7, mitochondrial [Diplodia seriata]|uniref:Required for respiratory growth protein 7, mitochondrial n=1 Tax=Diplodia seriata TaxID=420778 RepID=A0A1S8B3G0_9PEZI|nr:Required for respiratory growth protein 7, mitochondrial [Diplodia seriata]
MRPPLLLRSFKPPLLWPILTPTRGAASSSSKKKTSAPTEPAIAPGSEHHHDLPSFLAYASRVNLEPNRSVYVGTHYEYTVAATLKRLGFRLTRTGRASDFGIDLLGTWHLPIPKTTRTKRRIAVASDNGAGGDDDSSRSRDGSQAPLRVLVQCKASNTILNPKNVRELEGAFTGAPARWREEDFLGLLATTKKATKGVMEALGRSRWPMGFLKVEPDGRVEQFLWNASARARGLEGLGVTLRYMVDERNEDGQVKSDIALTWLGRPLPYVDLTEEAEALPALQMKIADIVEEEASDTAPEGVEEKPEKKKRGKSRKGATDTASETSSKGAEEPPEKKKRGGRPKKKAAEPASDVASETSSEALAEKSEKKKRSRTKKEAPETSPEVSSGDIEGKSEKKKAGRPKKKKDADDEV